MPAFRPHFDTRLIQPISGRISMSKFFSQSSGRRHYAQHDHGSDYYKRSHQSHSGILGWIFSNRLAVTPKRRQISTTGTPDSACLTAAATCSSVNRDFFIAPPLKYRKSNTIFWTCFQGEGHRHCKEKGHIQCWIWP